MINKVVNVILVILAICLLIVVAVDIAAVASIFGPRWLEISTTVYG